MRAAYFLLLGSSVALAQPLTLERAVHEATQNNPEIKEYREKVVEAEAQAFLARSALFPTVSAVADYQVLKDAANATKPRFDGTSFNYYSVSVKASQPFITWGLFSGVSVPKRDRDLKVLDVEINERNLLSSAMRTFYKLLLNQRYVEILKHTQSIQQESLATAQQRQRSGRGQLLDVLQVKTQLALLSPKIAKAENDASLAAAELMKIMGVQLEGDLHVVGKLDIVPLMEIKRELDLKDAKLPEYKKVFLTKEKVSALREVAMGKHYPSLAVIGTWGRANTLKSEILSPNSIAWMVGLELSVPLFSGFSSIADRRIYASQLAQLELEQRKVENELSLAQVQGLKNLQLAEENVGTSITAFNLAEDSMKEAKKKFQYANIDFLQYLSVQQAYLEAASSLDLAKYQYIDSLVNYFVSSGQSLAKLSELLGSQRI